MTMHELLFEKTYIWMLLNVAVLLCLTVSVSSDCKYVCIIFSLTFLSHVCERHFAAINQAILRDGVVLPARIMFAFSIYFSAL